MTADGFLIEMASYWPRQQDLSAAQRRVLLDALSEFSSDELTRLLREAMRAFEYAPKLNQILTLAEEKHIRAAKPHKQVFNYDWEPTGCKLCGGEGMLQVVMLHEYQRSTKPGEPNKRFRRFVELGRYSDIKWISRKHGDGEYSYAFRCSCPAGILPQHPKAWPRWESGRYHGDAVALKDQASQQGPEKFEWETIL